MHFNDKTRELSSDSGYIHALDDSLYTNYPIYLGIFDSPDNYEEGNAEDYEEWVKQHEIPDPELPQE